MNGRILLAGGTVALLASTVAVAQQRLARLPTECRQALIEQCRGSADRRTCIFNAMPKLPDQCRKAISDNVTRRAPPLPAGFRELAYGAHERQKLDLGFPQGADGKHPVLLFVHGGGWSIGDKRQGAASKGAHFLKQGWAFATTNYRLVPDATVEQQAADVAAAISFLRKQPGLDGNRIVVMGHSAGAHLAALVGTDERYLAAAGVPMAAVKGVILLDGAGYDVGRQIATKGNQVVGAYAAAFGADPKRHAALSPAHHAAAPNAANWLILPVASRADSTAQSEALAAKLRAAGAAATVSAQAGKSHRTLNRELGEAGDRSTGEVDRFLAALR